MALPELLRVALGCLKNLGIAAPARIPVCWRATGSNWSNFKGANGKASAPRTLTQLRHSENWSGLSRYSEIRSSCWSAG